MMLLKLLLIGAASALVTCALVYMITPGHPNRRHYEWLEGSKVTSLTEWSFETAEYTVINPWPFGRLRAALHGFLYH